MVFIIVIIIIVFAVDDDYFFFEFIISTHFLLQINTVNIYQMLDPVDITLIIMII